MTYRLIRALAGATRRTLPWRVLAACGLMGAIPVAVPVVASARLQPEHHVTLLRLAALAGAIGAAFLLDDPARSITSVVPTSRLLRWSVRGALVLPPAVAWWAAIVGITWYGTGRDLRAATPFTTITVEAAALLVTAVTLGAAATRLRDTSTGGALAVPALLGLVALLVAAPRSVALVLTPGDPRWTPVHGVWAVLLAGVAVAFVLLAHEPVHDDGRPHRLPTRRRGRNPV